MPCVQRLGRAGPVGLLGGLLLMALAERAAAQAPGCRLELSGPTGAELTAQVFNRDAAGGLQLADGPATRVSVRSGQLLRVAVRPLAGSDQPPDAGCPVKVEVGALEGVARRLTPQGFVFYGGNAFGQFRPGEERVLDFELKPFAEWSSPSEDVELENLVIDLPESREFVAGLPPVYEPPDGTICADVVYSDARPAAGIALQLRVPPDAAPQARTTGGDGRACWDGLDDATLYGEVALDPGVQPALGQSRTRYVSPRASYRLFVVKRPG